ncbi:hypothetical protein HDU97_008752 [Phlyctochytrium planicorne]|nr:hypothetical protein HDU97_008752 [Phlyctochytrium planicorne]
MRKKQINQLLELVDIPLRINRLTECVPSLFIALFEGLLRTRIDGIERGPNAITEEVRTKNARKLLRAMEVICLRQEGSLSHISIKGLVNGRETDVENVIEVLWLMARTLYPDKFILETWSTFSAEEDEQQASSSDESDHLGNDVSSEDLNLNLSDLAGEEPARSRQKRARSGLPKRPLSLNDDIDEFLANDARSQRFNDSSKQGILPKPKQFAPTAKKIKFAKMLDVSRKAAHSENSGTTSAKKSKEHQANLTRQKRDIHNAISSKSALIPTKTVNNYLDAVAREYRRETRRDSPEVMAELRNMASSNSDSDENEFRRNNDSDDDEEDSEDDEDQEEYFAEKQPKMYPPKDRSSPQSSQGITQSEMNLFKLKQTIKKELAIESVPKKVERDAWKGNIRDWKKALDQRLFERQVRAHQLQEGLYSEMKRSAAENSQPAKSKKKPNKAAKKVADTRLNNQRERVIRMENMMKTAEAEVAAILKRRKMEEEKIVKDLYDEYIARQREVIRFTSRLRRDEFRESKAKENIRREAKENYNREQLRMLQEELHSLEKEEKLVAKAQSEELRKVVREQKENAKKSIQNIKQKLSVDERTFDLRSATASQLKKGISFRTFRV